MTIVKSFVIDGGLTDPARRKVLATAASAAVLSGTGLLASPSVFAQANRASGRNAKSFTVGYRDNPNSLDPHTGSGGTDHTILFTMFDTLIIADNDFRPQPGLAQSWELRGDRELLLKIRRGVKFHDGTTLDAAAVKWNFDRIKDPKTRATAAASVSAIESVQVVDSYSVLIRTSAPSAPLLLNLADRAGMMISPASVAKYGEEVRRNPVGTGPYRFDSWRQDSHVRVVANESYWDQKNMARTGAINYRIFANEAPMIAALQTGEVDIGLLAETSVPILRTAPKVSLIVRPGARVLGLRGNNSIGPLGDRNIRLAMAHTFDRDQIFNTLFKDGGTRGDGIISPAHAWAFDSKFKGPVRDLTKARALLKQSSMPDGFEFKIAAPTSVPEAVSVAQILQAQLKEIGVTVSINNMELSRMLPAIKAGTMHAQSSFFSIRPDPDGYIFDQYHSSGFFYYGKDPQPLIDKLLTRARQSFDMAERRSLYLQAQEAVINLQATGFVWGHGSATWAVNKRIKGFSAGPEGKGRFQLVEVT